MIYCGLVVGGRLVLPPESAVYLGRYEQEPMHVEVTPVHRRRTLPQNRRMWAGLNNALKRAATLMPYDKDEIHNALKNRSEVIPVARLYMPNGEPLGDVKSTKGLSVPMFGDYMEEVTATFARGGIDIYESLEPPR